MRKLIILVMMFLFTSFHLFSFTSISLEPMQADQSSFENHDLLIITVDSYKKQCTRVIEHKNKLDIHCILRTTEDIYNVYNGTDKSEKIKHCIKQAYDDFHISSVLLIGDFKDIPVRYCHNNDEFGSLEPFFISDLYYADLYDENGFFSTWDADGDGLYGEWDGNEADDKNISLTPEISIGRLPCATRFEVRTMINKIIDYETGSNNKEWFHRIVVAGGDTYSAARGYTDDVFMFYEGEQLNQEVVNILSDFEATTLFASEGTLSTFSVLKEISKGCGFLYLSGHGSPGLWVTHPPDSAEKVGNFPNYLIPLLRNKDKLPVCIVGGCQNSKFDVHPLNLVTDPFLFGTWYRECWSWKLTSIPRGGSIATIGCTGLSWQGIEFGGGGTDWLNLQFFRNYANGTTTLGSIWRNAINSYLETFPIDWNTPSGDTSSIDAKTVQEWTLFGDPTLQIKN